MKFHHQLNRPPRSAKHGSNWRAPAPSHRHPVVGADHGAGGAAPGGIATLIAGGTVVTKFRPGAFTFTSFDVADAANDFTFAFTKPKPPTIPNAGIRTGEIIGHRLWFIVDGRLSSLAHLRIWRPGETVVGDTNEIVRHDPLFIQVIWGGTYAFARRDQCDEEITDLTEVLARVAHNKGRGFYFIGSEPAYLASGLVVGTVKMWGDVVEHETGYRAEFAKLNSIDELYGKGDIDALRVEYGMSPTL